MDSKSTVRLGGAYVEITADNGKLIDALHDSETRVQSFSKAFAKAGAAFSGIGVGITAPMKKAVEAYGEFEKQMLITRNVTKAAGYQMEKLTRQAKELGATTSWTTAQVAQGMTSLARMGFSTKEIEKSISSVMDLGRALDVDVSTAAKEVGAVMRQFGADASQAGHFADALATATNSAAIEMGELLESMKYVGAAGNAIGADVETVLALTMALRDSGISASQAGTQLRSMFLKFQNPKDVALFADQFGVAIHDANGRLKSFLDIVVEAQKRARVMGDELAVIARRMFGTLQAPGFITLLKSRDLERFRDELYKCDGAAEKFRKEMESGVYGALKLSESAVEAVGLQLGETLAPSVNETRELIQDVSEIIRVFVQNNGPFINTLARTGVAFTAFGSVILAGTGVVKGFAGVWNLATGAIHKVHAAWRKAGADLNVVNTEVATLSAEMETLAATAATADLAAPFASVTAAAQEAAAAVGGLNSKFKGASFKTGFGLEPDFKRVDTKGMEFADPVLFTSATTNNKYRYNKNAPKTNASATGQDSLDFQRTQSAINRDTATASARREADVSKEKTGFAIDEAKKGVVNTGENIKDAFVVNANQATSELYSGLGEATLAIEEAKQQADYARAVSDQAHKEAAETAASGTKDRMFWEEYRDSVESDAKRGQDAINTETEQKIKASQEQTARDIEAAKNIGADLAPVEPYLVDQQNQAISEAKNKYKEDVAAPKSIISQIDKERNAIRKQAKTGVNQAWENKYSRNKVKRDSLRSAAEEYISETAEPQAKLDRFLDRFGVRGAGKNLKDERSRAIKEFTDGLEDSYDEHELKYIRQVIEANGDQEKLKNIPTEFYDDQIAAQDKMLQGRTDAEGTAPTKGMRFISPQRAEELQGVAAKFTSSHAGSFTELEKAAEKESKLLGFFDKATAEARDKFDATTREHLGDGLESLQETVNRRADEVNTAKKNLDTANKRIDNPTNAVKQERKERSAKADDLQKEIEAINKDVVEKNNEMLAKQKELNALTGKKNGAVDMKALRKELEEQYTNEEKFLIANEGKLLSDETKITGEELKRLEKKHEKLGYALDTNDLKAYIPKQSKLSNEENERISTLNNEIEGLDAYIQKQSSLASTKERERDELRSPGAEEAKMYRAVEEKKSELANAEQRLVDAQAKLDYAKSDAGRAETDARRRDDIVGFAREQQSNQNKANADAESYRADEYKAAVEAIANAETRRDETISVANQNRSDYVAYKEQESVNKKAQDEAVEQAKKAGEEREKKIREDQEKAIEGIAKPAQKEIADVNAEIEAIDKRVSSAAETAKASDDAVVAAEKAQEAAEKNRDNIVESGDKTKKEIETQLNKDINVTDKETKQALDNLEKTRKDTYKVIEDDFKTESKNLQTAFNSRAETYDAVGKSLSVGSGESGHTFTAGSGDVNFSTTKNNDVNANAKAMSALEEEGKQLRARRDALLKRQRELDRLAYLRDAYDRKRKEAIGDRSLPPDERRRRINMFGARNKYYEEAWNNGFNSFQENKASFFKDLTSWKGRYRSAKAGAGFSTSSAPQTTGVNMSATAQTDGVDQNLAEYWKNQKQAADQQRKEALNSFYALRRDARQGTTNTPRDVLRSQQKAFLDAARKARNAGTFADYNMGTLAGTTTMGAGTFLPGDTLLSGDSRFVGDSYSAMNVANAGAGSSFTINEQAAQAFDKTTSAARGAADATYKFSSATKEATINGKSFTVETNNAATATAKVGVEAEKSAFGLQALKMAGNAALGALKMLGGMAVSMLAWGAVMAIFEKIAEYAHKTAEDMRKAGELAAEVANKDQETADNAISEADTDTEKINAFLEKAGSKEPLNAIEQKRLDDQYQYLKDKGILTDAEVTKDENGNYHIQSAAAANQMKARALGLQIGKLEKEADNQRVSLYGLNPDKFKQGEGVTVSEAKERLKDMRPGYDALSSLNELQLEAVFGADKTKGFTKKWTGQGNLFQRVGQLSNPYGSTNMDAGKDALLSLVDDVINDVKSQGNLGEQQEKDLRDFILGASTFGYNPETGDFRAVNTNSKFLEALSNDNGAAFIDRFKKIDGLGASSKTAELLKEEQEAYLAEAEKEKDKPYESQYDKEKAERDAEEQKRDTEEKQAVNAKSFDAMGKIIENGEIKNSETELTASERKLAELERQWIDFIDSLDISKITKDQSRTLEEYNEKIQEQRKLLKEKAEEERKEKLKDEADEELGKQFDSLISELKNVKEKKGGKELDYKNADDAMNKLIQSVADYKQRGVDMTAFYRASAQEVKSMLNQTKTTLSSTTTMNAYEAMQLSQDVALDAQRQQLNEMRRLNENAQMIYAWMTTQDEYKEYL